MTVAPDATELAGGTEEAAPPAPSTGGRMARGVLRVLGGALLIVVGVLSPLIGLTAAMFSEGLKEPWRSNPQAFLFVYVAFGIACLVAAAGVMRGRRWGTILAAGAIVALLLVSNVR
jgi:hypothetical protein